ncbi:MAG: hypothetical protein IJ786_03540 [Bacteroidaceae bacterium]|nr:hypothetical protein [Bacteroidaceae bacterium]
MSTTQHSTYVRPECTIISLLAQDGLAFIIDGSKGNGSDDQWTRKQDLDWASEDEDLTSSAERGIFPWDK